MTSQAVHVLVFDGQRWGVITASGLAPVEFAREILRQLKVFSAADDDLWFDMFKHGRLPESAV